MTLNQWLISASWLFLTAFGLSSVGIDVISVPGTVILVVSLILLGAVLRWIYKDEVPRE